MRNTIRAVAAAVLACAAVSVQASQPGEKLSPDELKAQFARDYVEVESR